MSVGVSSGQALGGHMRRHRAAPTATTTESNEDVGRDVKERNILPLDLNLPAPMELEDDHHREIKFEFDRSKQCLVFSGPALVDCRY